MDWPELSWEVPPQRREWLSKRVRQLGDLAYRFDAAVMELIAAGAVTPEQVQAPLAAFRYQASLVYVYLQLEVESASPPSDEIPTHAEELRKTEQRLRALRQELLAAVGPDVAQRLAVAEASQDSADGKTMMRHAGIQPSWPPPELKVDMLPAKKGP